jgi:hypothetical protein
MSSESFSTGSGMVVQLTELDDLSTYDPADRRAQTHLVKAEQILVNEGVHLVGYGDLGLLVALAEAEVAK